MSKDLRRMIVVDLEATCWEGPQDTPDRNPLFRGDSPRPADAASEIIEIGLCELDLRTFERTKKTSILIRPQRGEVSPFCTRLTSLTPQQVAAEGVTYEEAIAQVEARFNPRHAVWASWGAYDREMFETEARRRWTGGPDGETVERRKAEAFVGPPRALYPWSRLHVNAKNMMSLLMGRFDGEFGMAHACKVAGLPLEGTHHRGHDDAWNIAGLIAWMLGHTQPAFAAVRERMKG